jgi:hypothetical protein
MADQWVLTWARVAFVPVFVHKNNPPPTEHMAFDSQKDAVDFAMSLDNPQRQTAQLHLPCGDIADLRTIQEMYATKK